MLTALPLLLVIVLMTGAMEAWAATNPRLKMPQSHLGPSADTPIFLAIHGQVGSALEYESGVFGYGADLLFRPGAAVDFLSFLYNWNAGVCMQIDYQNITDSETILSADFIVRKYLEDMRDPKGLSSPFLGLGFGASRVEFPAGISGSSNKYWSLVAEAGLEKTLKEKYLIWIKGQYRYYDHSDVNFSNLVLQVGMGIPLPW